MPDGAFPFREFLTEPGLVNLVSPDGVLPFRAFLAESGLVNLVSPDGALLFRSFLAEPALTDFLPPDDVLSFLEFRIVTITILNLNVYKKFVGKRVKIARVYDCATAFCGYKLLEFPVR